MAWKTKMLLFILLKHNSISTSNTASIIGISHTAQSVMQFGTLLVMLFASIGNILARATIVQCFKVTYSNIRTQYYSSVT